MKKLTLTLCVLLVAAAGVSVGADIGPSVAGQVLDEPFGEPAADILVTLWNGWDGRRSQTRTDTNGQYVFADVAPSEHYKVWIDTENLPPGTWTEHSDLIVVDSAPVRVPDLCMTWPQRITGVIRDAKTGKPIAEAGLNFGTKDRNRDAVQANTEGEFCLYVRPRTVSIKCTGTWDRYLGSKRYTIYNVISEEPITVTLGQHVANVVFEIESGPKLTGSISNADGSPAVNVSVVAHAYWHHGGGSGGGGKRFTGTTDTVGKYSIYLREPGHWEGVVNLEVEVVARSADSAQAGFTKLSSDADLPSINVEPIRLGQVSTVSFSVIDQLGKPVTGVKIQASRPYISGTDRYTGQDEDLGDGRYLMANLIPNLEQAMLLYAEGFRGWTPRDSFTLTPGETRDIGTYTIKWGDARALPEYIAGLSDPKQIERFAERIGSLGANGAPAVSRLFELLQTEPKMSRRYSIAIALGKIGPPARAAVPALIYALEHDEWPVQRDAAEALGLIGDPAAIPALTRILSHPERDVCINAINALGRLGSSARSALPHLINLAESGSRRDIREAAIKALGPVGNTSALPTLVRLRNDEDESIRQHALEAIHQIDR